MIDLTRISIGLIEPNSWNPQEQDEGTMAELVASIKQVGFIDPIEVVPLSTGKYRIIGGEHRWQAAKSLGLSELPVVILTDAIWQDEDLQKFQTVKLNILSGKINGEKFLKIYQEMADKYGAEALQKLFGFTDVKALDRLVGKAKQAIKKSLPKSLQDEFEDKSKSVKSAEDLTKIVQSLLLKHGDTISSDFIIFTFGKREHIYLPVDRASYERLAALADHAYKEGVPLIELLSSYIAQAADNLPKKSKTGPGKKPPKEDATSY